MVIVFLGLFVVSVYFFRKPPPAAPFVEDGDAAPEVEAAPRFTLDLESTEAHLEDVTGGSASGTATRGAKNGDFFHTLKADLPAIDRETTFYEGWLVKLIPFSYFSTGEMVTNELGEFVLEWAGETDKDYKAYTKVVITVEAKDGNPDPAAHVLEGTFGN